MTKIPSRLKKEQFRFVLVGRKKKYPFESSGNPKTTIDIQMIN